MVYDVILISLIVFLILFYFCAVRHKDEYSEMRELIERQRSKVGAKSIETWREEEMEALRKALD